VIRWLRAKLHLRSVGIDPDRRRRTLADRERDDARAAKYRSPTLSQTTPPPLGGL
jgi:hypothetical protein